MTWDGETPPYVKRLDPDYFERRLGGTQARLDFPQLPDSPRPTTTMATPSNETFLHVGIEFDHRHPVDSVLTGFPNRVEIPTVIGTWETGDHAFAIEPASWGLGLVVISEKLAADGVIIKVPAGAKTITLSSKGWGGDTYAVVTLSGADPVDPYN